MEINNCILLFDLKNFFALILYYTHKSINNNYVICYCEEK